MLSFKFFRFCRTNLTKNKNIFSNRNRFSVLSDIKHTNIVQTKTDIFKVKTDVEYLSMIDSYVSDQQEKIFNVKEYVFGIIKSESFNKDPEKYMNVWKFERGHTEEYRMTEDTAFNVIKNMLKDKIFN
jgi:hypothetical protein